jgi:hypothetical protein
VGRSFIVYQGEDETPEFDLTDPDSNVHVKFEEIEAGGKAFRGESTTNSIPVRDQQGETGNPLNLPGALTHVSLSRGSRWEWLDGPDGSEVRMAAGRIGTKDYTRGVQPADRAREVVMQCGDRNEELQDIIVDAWDRGEETDVVRVNALITAYLSGSPRTTTNIANTYVSSDNPVTLPARLYDGTNPRSILQEIASFANKEFFVTIDDELWYDVATSTSYLAGLKISDRPDEWTFESSIPGPERLYFSNSTEPMTTPPVADAGWDSFFSTVTGLFASPQSSVNGQTDSTDGDVNDDVCLLRSTWEIDAGLASTLAAGGATVRAQIRTSARNGVGINEGAQSHFSQMCIRVTEGDTTTIRGTALPLHNELGPGGMTRWPAQPTYVNTKFPATSTPDTLDAVPGATAGDFLVVEVGYRTFNSSATPHGGGVWVMDASGSDLPENETSTSNYNSWIDIGAEEELPVFPPKWDVGPASSEDGLELVSGLRLYYGQQGDYVHVTDATTEAEYWHAERSFYTSDESITDATKATVLAEAILQRLKFEDRTYNVSVGPLYNEHVGLLKPGQLVDIKARAIPDADDQYVSRRIAQLKWTTPRPGVFWARMQLDRPLKEAPYGVGPKQSAEEIAKHTQASSSHTASQVTIIDADGNFTATDVEGALDELFDALGGGGVTDHGALTGLADNDHPQYALTTDGEQHVINVVAASGSTETLDLGDGNVHDVTLTDDCTLTLTGATNGVECQMRILLRQGASPPHLVTWPAAVEWVGNVAPTLPTALNSWDWVALVTLDGGTTWYGQHAGTSSGSSASTTPSILLESGHATPFTFDEILQESDGSDFLRASE